MKLSFSLTSKHSSNATSKPPQQQSLKNPFSEDDQTTADTTAKQYVTEFDSTKPPTDPSKSRLVIPPKPNEWRPPTKKLKNLSSIPDQSDDSHTTTLQFELDPTDSSSVNDPTSSMSYGLNVRNFAKPNSEGDHSPAAGAGADPMLHKLREDLKRLPEDNGFEEFQDVPVEGFGAALLAGYGWYEGRGIGRNAKEDVKVVEFKKRTSKEGLGFTGELVPTKVRNNNHHGISNGSVRSNRGYVKEAEEKKGGLYVGKDVRVIEGSDMGMKGRVVELKGNMVVLRLSRSEKDVTVHGENVAELGSSEEERCLRKLKDVMIKKKKSASSKDSERGKGSSSSGKREREEVSRVVPWLTSHIRVRVISKDLKGGRLYLKKGEVVDVVGPTTCDISMDEGRELVQGVDQDLLETALPRRGGPVLVLYGRHKGVYGSLVERDAEKEIGVVRDADTHELLTVKLEQIAEYICDPSYIGY